MSIFKYQLWHLLVLGVLLLVLASYVTADGTVLNGELWSISTYNWMVFTILCAISHQLYVLVCWRSELHYQSISRLLGQNGFKAYKLGFAILGLSRPTGIALLAISSRMTLSINPVLSYLLSGLLTIPAAYLFYSVKKYFGFDRAFGIDHFQPEDYKRKPFVDEGIFRYTRNGMYTFGFFSLWIPGLLLQSKAALCMALFSHMYIWVHYYCTELPDLRTINGEA